jgi:hypothetical protein
VIQSSISAIKVSNKHIFPKFEGAFKTVKNVQRLTEKATAKKIVSKERQTEGSEMINSFYRR